MSLKQVENASAVPGVVASSPEAYAPAIAFGRVLVVRGVNESEFSALQPTTLINRTGPLTGEDVYVGEELARSMALAPGTSFELQGILANATTTAAVTGIISAGAPFDDEIIAPLRMAQELRGLSPGQVTFFRLKVDPAVFDTAQLIRSLGGTSTSTQSHPSTIFHQLQLAPTTTLISILPAGSTPTPSLATALQRGLGLAQSAFESLDVVVLLASLLAVYFATASWLATVRPTAETLSSLGLGGRRLLLWLLAVAVPASAVAGLAGYAIAYLAVRWLTGTGTLSFFFHPLMVGVEPTTVAISCVGPALVVALSVLTTAGRSHLRGPRRAG